MSTLTTIQGADLITNSRADINNNFSALNTDKMETSVLDSDTTLAANSDSKVATQKAVKAYVDSGGNTNASTTNKGIVEEATQDEISAGTAAGASGARLFINPSSYIGSFGDGSDGDVTISSPTTLTRDMYYNSLTVESTLTTDGYKVYVKGQIAGSGTITWGTANAGSTPSAPTDSTPITGGAGGTQSGNGFLKNVAGGAGGTATAGGVAGGNNSATATVQTPAIGSSGVAGGAGGTGDDGSAGSGATGGTVSMPHKFGNLKSEVVQMMAPNSSGTLSFILPQGQSTGGGSGCGDDAFTGTGCAGSGGGAGASGGTVFIAALTFAGSFTITSVGGAGGNGAAAFSSSNAIVGGGGGGAGGNGGSVVMVYSTSTWAGTATLTGGAGGTGGAGAGGGGTGSTGTTGATGTTYAYQINSLL